VGLAPPGYADVDIGIESYKAGNYEAATEIWRSLALAGDPRAQASLGLMYIDDSRMGQSVEEAFGCFRLAADQGLVFAQRRSSVMHAAGEGVSSNQEEAVRCYRMAAEQGYAPAQYNLGVRSDNGDDNAQINLGVMYASGTGVSQD
tara:strand:+ start:154 stop:591 length:438 start_codon:yes stop_codon:yes gene_type:complete